MKRTIKVGIIQQTCTNDIRHNLSKLHHNIDQESAAGAQLVVLQELSQQSTAELSSRNPTLTA